MSKKCGYITIIGRPNVGKSTLLNYLLGQKISITSKKPQTTRHQILGIKTEADVQMVFIDTPGIHTQNKKALNRYLNKAALTSLHDVDVVLWVIEPRWSDDEDFILKKLGNLATPVILVLNKVDRIQDKNKLLPMMQMFKDKFPFRDVVPISAETGDNVALLCQVISQYLPEQEFIFDEDQLTDKSTRFLIAEIIREKLMRYLGEELPYATTVQIDAFKEEAAINDISATIFVERTSQKAIVIGEAGAGLKKIGTDARRDLEQLLGKKVMLRLWVKVKSNWADDDAALKSLGYN
jgi:GTP-binding protein Era